MAWAKLWPALTLPIRDRGADREHRGAGGAARPVQFLLRLPIALVLIAMQRPWSRTLGAFMARPNMYWGQIVVIIAPISLWIQSMLRPEVPA